MSQSSVQDTKSPLPPSSKKKQKKSIYFKMSAVQPPASAPSATSRKMGTTSTQYRFTCASCKQELTASSSEFHLLCQRDDPRKRFVVCHQCYETVANGSNKGNSNKLLSLNTDATNDGYIDFFKGYHDVVSLRNHAFGVLKQLKEQYADNPEEGALIWNLFKEFLLLKFADVDMLLENVLNRNDLDHILNDDDNPPEFIAQLRDLKGALDDIKQTEYDDNVNVLLSDSDLSIHDIFEYLSNILEKNNILRGDEDDGGENLEETFQKILDLYANQSLLAIKHSATTRGFSYRTENRKDDAQDQNADDEDDEEFSEEKKALFEKLNRLYRNLRNIRAAKLHAKGFKRDPLTGLWIHVRDDESQEVERTERTEEEEVKRKTEFAQEVLEELDKTFENVIYDAIYNAILGDDTLGGVQLIENKREFYNTFGDADIQMTFDEFQDLVARAKNGDITAQEDLKQLIKKVWSPEGKYELIDKSNFELGGILKALRNKRNRLERKLEQFSDNNVQNKGKKPPRKIGKEFVDSVQDALETIEDFLQHYPLNPQLLFLAEDFHRLIDETLRLSQQKDILAQPRQKDVDDYASQLENIKAQYQHLLFNSTTENDATTDENDDNNSNLNLQSEENQEFLTKIGNVLPTVLQFLSTPSSFGINTLTNENDAVDENNNNKVNPTMQPAPNATPNPNPHTTTPTANASNDTQKQGQGQEPSSTSATASKPVSPNAASTSNTTPVTTTYPTTPPSASSSPHPPAIMPSYPSAAIPHSASVPPRVSSAPPVVVSPPTPTVTKPDILATQIELTKNIQSLDDLKSYIELTEGALHNLKSTATEKSNGKQKKLYSLVIADFFALAKIEGLYNKLLNENSTADGNLAHQLQALTLYTQKLHERIETTMKQLYEDFNFTDAYLEDIYGEHVTTKNTTASSNMAFDDMDSDSQIARVVKTFSNELKTTVGLGIPIVTDKSVSFLNKRDQQNLRPPKRFFLNLLYDAFSAMARKQGFSALLSGRQGIGKTRISQMLAHALDAEYILVTGKPNAEEAEYLYRQELIGGNTVLTLEGLAKAAALSAQGKRVVLFIDEINLIPEEVIKSWANFLTEGIVEIPPTPEYPNGIIHGKRENIFIIGAMNPFSQLSSDPAIQRRFKTVYNVNVSMPHVIDHALGKITLKDGRKVPLSKKAKQLIFSIHQKLYKLVDDGSITVTGEDGEVKVYPDVSTWTNFLQQISKTTVFDIDGMTQTLTSLLLGSQLLNAEDYKEERTKAVNIIKQVIINSYSKDWGDIAHAYLTFRENTMKMLQNPDKNKKIGNDEQYMIKAQLDLLLARVSEKLLTDDKYTLNSLFDDLAKITGLDKASVKEFAGIKDKGTQTKPVKRKKA